MSDDKPNDEEHGEDSFNEDFDFGEGDNDTRPIQTTTSQGLNKKVVGSIIALVFVVISIMGYRIFKSPASSQINSLSAENKLPATMNPEVNAASSTILKEAKPEMPAVAAKTAPSAPATDKNFGEIAEAFSSADQTASNPSPQPKVTVEGSLRDLQNELFALEQPGAPSTAPTGTTTAETAQLSQGLHKLNQQIDYI